VAGYGAIAVRDGLYSPTPDVVAGSQLTAFMRFCEEHTGRTFPDQSAFHEFSVSDHRAFWGLLLAWSGVACEGSPEPVCTDDACERATFFPELRLSYAENLLLGHDDAPAVSAYHAGRGPDRLTRRQLRDRVLGLAGHLRGMGVGPGDRVAAIAGNNAEAVIAALGCAAVGATFSAAAPEMGAPAVLSRFEQLSPKLLMAGLAAGGEAASGALADRTAEVVAGLASLQGFVALDDGPVPPGVRIPVHRLADMVGGGGKLERFPFNHPLFILFTSGTTGSPKCIVHGAGGTLLEHVKEHRLHVDLRAGDRLFFHTSAAWMMWNWQLSALASGAEIVLYDGPLSGASTLWRVAAEERATVFGTSPPYLQLCEESGYSPRRELELADLRAVLSTGSILHDRQYDWVAEHVGVLPLQSISGGTDIVGCFVLGSPNLPVRRGWLQCRSLGMDVQSLDGELVCRNPFPSRPLGLLGDDGRRFHEAYFEQNPGVWTHGDLIEFDEHGQARMHGRSDGVINVHGLRIGPAEIYRALAGVTDVQEAMAVEQDDGLVLLVVLRPGTALDGRLVVRIRREIARNASPLHVPELVVQVDQLPTTHSGKRSERAARDALRGVESVNAAALANPDSLDAIRGAVGAARRERLELVARPDKGSTESRLHAIWEEVLGIAPLQPEDNFFDVGGTSLAALRLLEAIHGRMGVDLPLSILLDAPTIAAMASAIEAPRRPAAPALVLLRPGRHERPLFLVHSLYGDVLSMRPLALALRTDRAVYGLQARGLDPAEEPHTRVEQMAAVYMDSIAAVQPSGPYALGGHSLGGLVAFEMARMLVARGEGVEWLGLIDSDLHHSCLTAPERLRWLAWKSGDLLRSVRADPFARIPRYARKVALRLVPRAPLAMPERESTLPPMMRRLENAGWEAFDTYCPSPYPGPVTFFRVEGRREGMGDPLPVWRRRVRGGLTVEPVPGSHADVVAEPNVRILAERVSAHLGRTAG
jgi:acetoacetyl-CoA synthetase